MFPKFKGLVHIRFTFFFSLYAILLVAVIASAVNTGLAKMNLMQKMEHKIYSPRLCKCAFLTLCRRRGDRGSTVVYKANGQMWVG